MAWTVSGLYVLNWIDILDATQLAIDLSLTSHKIALSNNTDTPSYTADQAWTNSNEVSGTGWATGGVALSAAATGATSTAPTVTQSPSGSLMYDMADISVASTTLTNAYGAKIYETVLGAGATKALIVGIYFGGSGYSTSNGTFGIQWAATGVFAIDLTP